MRQKSNTLLPPHLTVPFLMKFHRSQEGLGFRVLAYLCVYIGTKYLNSIDPKVKSDILLCHKSRFRDSQL